MPVNPELIDAIASEPEETAPYLVYADWLQAQSDPRGELITIQNQLRDDPSNRSLLNAEEKLLTEHTAHFFGQPHPDADKNKPGREQAKRWMESRGWSTYWTFGYFNIEWFVGFARRLAFHPGYYWDESDGPDAPAACTKILADFLSHPSARFVHTIEVGDIWSDYVSGMGPELGHISRAIADSPAAASLRVLDFVGGDHDINGVGGDASPLWKACPNLQVLELYGNDLSMGTVKHSKLKKLTVYSGGLPQRSVKQLAEADLPEAEELWIMFGQEEYGAGGDIQTLRPLFNTKTLPKVTKLGLCNSEFAPEIVQELAGSMILKQLTELDLSMGTLDDETARPLLENWDAFSHLKKIDVSANFLTLDFNTELKSLCETVVHEHQRDPSYGRYASVGE